MMSDFLQDLRVLQLGFEHILLIALSNAIARFRSLLHLTQQLIAFLQNAEGLLNVSQFEVDHLEVSDDHPAN